MWRTAILTVITLGSAASAQSATAPCRAVAAPPAPLAGWNDRKPLVSLGGLIDAGDAIDLKLTPIISEERVSTSSAKAAAAGRYGGRIGLRIARAGRYRVALGNAAWVDLVRYVARGDGGVMSVGHGHGPACTGIRKMVDFVLSPGRYDVLVMDSSTPTVALMVARLP